MVRPRRVTIDLTPLLPGGANGGAKVLALALIREMAELAPEIEFVLLTSPQAHSELSSVESANVRRQPTDVDALPTVEDEPALARARTAGRLLVNTVVPPGARSHIKDAAWRMLKRRRRQQVTQTISQTTDLHFSPFTAPFFFDPMVPLVSLVHDVQFVDLPDFFEEHQRQERLQHLQDACMRADRLVCVSEFVCQGVLRNCAREPESVTVIHSAVLHDFVREQAPPPRDMLKRLGVCSTRYLLYPANAWPHKNHRRLLEAFATLLRRQPDSNLALIWTGEPGAAFDELGEFARQILPAGRFAFAGYVSEVEFSGLMHNCRGLIFPSLYEGFGLPVVEAMACGRPVLCSNETSLPEVVGDAAVLFDPYNPLAIATAIERLESDPQLERNLVERGKQRAEKFGSAREMATRYLTVFEEVMSARQRPQ